VKAGIQLGISSRGIGSTRQVRDGVEVTQLKLITYDLVAEPSFANAILSPDKSKGLSESLNFIESKLPLNESVESQSVRGMIANIRESLLTRKTVPVEEVDIKQIELDSLKELLESAQKTIDSDTVRMKESRSEVKKLRKELQEADEKYKGLLRNMIKLQESYNKLKDVSLTEEEIKRLKEDLLEARKQLAVEKRGMAYTQVSELLEGVTSESEIESRLNSLSSLGRKRQTKLMIESNSLPDVQGGKKLQGLAAIISRV
jgi:hypothetical protein